jgi:glycosyltransferase involved in cell wall biosynthesis
MEDNVQNDSVAVDQEIRPAFIVDGKRARQYATCLRHMLSGLAGQSRTSALICPTHANASDFLCPSAKLIYYPISNLLGFYWHNRKLVLEELKKFKPTILHCLSPSRITLTRYLSEQLNVPYIVMYDSPRDRYFNWFSSKKRCEGLIALTKGTAEHLQKIRPEFAGHIYQVAAGAFAEDTCACFSNDQHVTSIVLAQPLDNSLDYKPFLHAIRHLAIDGYEFVTAIIGTGPAEREMHTLIKQLGISQIVTMVGDLDPIRLVFAGADIYFHFRPRHDFDPSLLEAISAGLVVACSRGEDDDLLIEDQTCRFFDSDDELSIYTALQNMLDDKQATKQIAIASQQKLKESHTVSEMIEALIRAYTDAQNHHQQKLEKE